MSLPMVNQRQASPSRRLSEDELNFVPQRQQKYIRNPSPMTDRPLYPRASENKYVENDYSNYKRRVQDRFTNAFNPRNQVDSKISFDLFSYYRKIIENFLDMIPTST